MAAPFLYKYKLVLITEKKKRYNITKFIQDLSWAEKEKELAARITFMAKNSKTSKGRLSSLAKPGCWVILSYSYNGGAYKEAVRGKIVEWNPSTKATGEQFSVKAYDLLYDLQESADNIYFPKGRKTPILLREIFKKWGIPLGAYSGPNIKHGKEVFRNQKLGKVVFDILEEANNKGGVEAIPRAEKNKVSIVAYGSNQKVFHLSQTKNITNISHKVSTVGMVTRVKVVGQEKSKGKNKGKAPVYATVNGNIQYGIRQKLYVRNKKDSMKKAKKEAQKILKEEGSPKNEVSVKTFDLPFVRKGHTVSLSSTTANGYYYVMSVTHNCDERTMDLDLKKVPQASLGEASKSKKKYHVGDVVTFIGGHKQYSSAKGKKGTKIKGSGKAKIKKIKNGAKHPYYLATRNWSKSRIHGWVDKKAFN